MPTIGLEPSGLFNMVQFMMFDEDNSGAVTVDETMTMIYQRYGKDNLLKVGGTSESRIPLP